MSPRARVLRYVLVAVLAMLLGGLGLVFFTRPTMFEGKTASLYAFAVTDPDPALRGEAEAAIKRSGTRLVEDFGQLLLSKDVVHRRWVWDNVLRLPALVKPFLLNRVKPPDAYRLRTGAARALELLGPAARPTLPQLERALAKADLTEATALAQTLSAIGPDAVPVLVQALRHPNPYIRPLAAATLGGMGTNGLASTTALQAAMADPDPQLAAAAAHALDKQQKEVLRQQVEQASSLTGQERIAAVRTIARMQGALALLRPVLMKMLRDADPEARRTALELFQQAPPPGLPLPLIWGCLEDTNAAVRLEAVKLLGGLRPWNEETQQRVTRLREDPDPDVRETATRSLEAHPQNAPAGTNAPAAGTASPPGIVQ